MHLMGVHSRHTAAVAVNGGKIRQLRKQAGMEIAELAAAANVTTRHMSYVETGRKPRVKPTTFRLICEVLEVPVAQRTILLSDEERDFDTEPERAVA